jgi:hypothetical protein
VRVVAMRTVPRRSGMSLRTDATAEDRPGVPTGRTTGSAETVGCSVIESDVALLRRLATMSTSSMSRLRSRRCGCTE